MLKIIALLAVAPFAYTLTAGVSLDDAPRCQVIVSTFDGMIYVAGEGDDEQGAYEGIVIPENWREIRTQCRD